MFCVSPPRVWTSITLHHSTNGTVTSTVAQSKIDTLLREHGTGVLALANGREAYSIPESFGYDGETLHFQFVFDVDSKKMAFLETTETASFTIYTSDSTDCDDARF